MCSMYLRKGKGIGEGVGEGESRRASAKVRRDGADARRVGERGLVGHLVEGTSQIAVAEGADRAEEHLMAACTMEQHPDPCVHRKPAAAHRERRACGVELQQRARALPHEFRPARR